MRKSLIPLVALALPLGACATNPYGYGSDPLTGILGALGGSLGASQGAYGYGNSGFSQAAVNACGSIAARYGQVGIRDVRQVSGSTVRVYGMVSNGYSSRNWDCDFRSDGRVTDFDI